MTKKISLTLLSLFACSLLLGGTVFAQEKNVNTLLDEAKGKITALEQKTSLEARIGGYIKVALSLVATILVILIIYAGFLWFTAGGNADQVQKAKDILKNCIIGVIIIASAYILTDFIIARA